MFLTWKNPNKLSFFIQSFVRKNSLIESHSRNTSSTTWTLLGSVTSTTTTTVTNDECDVSHPFHRWENTCKSHFNQNQFWDAENLRWIDFQKMKNPNRTLDRNKNGVIDNSLCHILDVSFPKCHLHDISDIKLLQEDSTGNMVSYEMMNRNARKAKRANHGKRPVSNAARRAKRSAYGNYRR